MDPINQFNPATYCACLYSQYLDFYRPLLLYIPIIVISYIVDMTCLNCYFQSNSVLTHQALQQMWNFLWSLTNRHQTHNLNNYFRQQWSNRRQSHYQNNFFQNYMHIWNRKYNWIILQIHNTYDYITYMKHIFLTYMWTHFLFSNPHNIQSTLVIFPEFNIVI